MIQTSFNNITPSANIIVNVKILITESSNLNKYEKKCDFDNLCMIGCPNYGNKWSCPPYSPKFSEYKKDYPYAIIALFWCSLEQFHYAKTEFIKVKASNSILKSRMDKFMRNLEHMLGGFVLSNGSCRLCNPCSKKAGLGGCKKPKEMRFSMESLGLDVGNISVDYFNHKLLWYEDKKAPTYSSVLSCLLTKDCVQEKELELFLRMQLI